MISVVYWLYRDPIVLVGGPRVYKPEYVNAQLPMLRRHCSVPYRVVCVTDCTDGLDSSIEVIAPPVTDDGPVVSRDPRYPRCYRRLWNFSEAARALGDRILALDIDSLIVRDIAPLVERDEDLVVWRAPPDSAIVLGAAYLLRTGTHTHIWTSFDFERSPQELLRVGRAQSDQGWLNYMLPSSVPAWTEADGMYLPPLGDPRPLPETARIVSFGTLHKPWMKRAHAEHPWIVEHYAA